MPDRIGNRGKSLDLQCLAHLTGSSREAVTISKPAVNTSVGENGLAGNV